MIADFFQMTSTWLPQVLYLFIFMVGGLQIKRNDPEEFPHIVSGFIVLSLLLLWGGFFG